MGRKKDVAISPAEISREKLKKVAETQDIDEIIELTKDTDPSVRARAVRTICPCKVLDK